MKDLGPCKTFLNVEITCDWKKRQIHLSQEHYAKKLLFAFGLEEAKPIWTPMDISVLNEMVLYNGQAIPTEIEKYRYRTGSLNYAATHTRPDLSYRINWRLR
jgi:hypothetical protein